MTLMIENDIIVFDMTILNTKLKHGITNIHKKSIFKQDSKHSKKCSFLQQKKRS